jgi:hypothetical protein
LTAVERWTLRQAAEDQVEVWSVLSRLEFEPHPVASDEERRKLVLSVLGTLLRGELIKPLDFVNGKFVEPALSWEQVLERLEREWVALGREPTLGDLFVFVATEKGVLACESR